MWVQQSCCVTVVSRLSPSYPPLNLALYIYKAFVCLYSVSVVHIYTQLCYNNVSGCTLGSEIARRIIADNFLQKYPIIFIPKSYTLQTSWLGWGCLPAAVAAEVWSWRGTFRAARHGRNVWIKTRAVEWIIIKKGWASTSAIMM